MQLGLRNTTEVSFIFDKCTIEEKENMYTFSQGDYSVFAEKCKDDNRV